MPVLNNVLAGAAGQSGGADYEISRSLRFNNGTLYRDFSAGHHLKWTWAGWVKRSGLGSNFIFQGGNTDYNDDGLLFNSNNKLQITFHNGSNAINGQLITSARYVDCSAWMHICLVSDCGNSVGNDRMRLYVNGLRITEFDTNNNPNVATGSHDINKASRHHIGSFRGSSDMFLGMMAECFFLDGHTPATATDDANGSVTGTPNAEYLTDFGVFSDTTGVWGPKSYSFPSAVKHKGDWIGDTTGSPFNTNDDSQIHGVFDGAASSGAPAATGTAFLFTPSTPITGISKVRLKVQRDSQQTDDHDLKLNGTNIGSNWSTGTTNTVEFTVNNLTSIQWATKSNQHWYKLYTIEIYYDGAWHFLEQADKNNFYLDYSDNSGSHTLGNDVVGTNNWTTSGITRVRAATGNHGVTLGTSTLNYDPSVIFNGDPSSAWVDRPINGNGVNFTGIPAANTQLRIRLHYIQSGTMTTNGGHQVATGNMNGAWIEPAGISYPFTLTSISVTGGNAGDGFGIGAVEVDGVVLDAGSGAETDSLLDSPTNYDDGTNIGGNYATWNRLTQKGSVTTSNGALEANAANSGTGYVLSTIPVSSGKFYCEISFGGTMSHNTNYSYLGIVPAESAAAHNGNDIFRAKGALSIDGNASSYIRGNLGTGSGDQNVDYQTSYGFDESDVIGIAIDCDTPQVTFYKNGVSTGTFPHAMQANSSWVVFINDWANAADTDKYILNAGQRPFSFAVPSGFKAMCTQNLDDPLIADPSTACDAKTYNGNGGTQTISGLNLSPDIVWLKSRSNADNHALFDTVRGAQIGLHTNLTSNEFNDPSTLTGFTSDGWTMAGHAVTNTNSANYIGWVWDSGSSNTTISAGSLNSSAYNSSRVWSNDWSTGIYHGSYTPDRVFDGDLTTEVATTYPATSTTITVNPAISGSVIRIYYARSSSSTACAIGSETLPSTGAGNVYAWHTIAATSISSITLSHSGSGASYIRAIEVDGKMLLDQGVTPVDDFPSIASTCRTNETAGTSIVSYTGVGAFGGARVAHNLNNEPDFMILKRRSGGAASWILWWRAMGGSGSSDYFFFESNNKGNGNYNLWDGTSPNSSVFTISNNGHVNAQNDPFIGYIFSAVDGYSQFGKYQSSGATFVTTGFRPKVVLFKSVVSAHWVIMDATRDIDNGMENHLHPNLNNGEATAGNRVDFLSNGFRLDSNYGETNDGQVYYYAAFAESPFKYSRAR